MKIKIIDDNLPNIIAEIAGKCELEASMELKGLQNEYCLKGYRYPYLVFNNVSFDSSFIGILIAIHSNAKKVNGHLILIIENKQNLKYFKKLKLNKYFSIFSNLKKAKKKWKYEK